MADFLNQLENSKILVADGATGTMLQKAGLPAGMPPEQWNLENPKAVKNHYLSYLNAGSDIILTNTFGGSPIRLEGHGLADDAYRINRKAAELAREAVGNQAIIFGDIGPTGILMAPLGSLDAEVAEEAFTLQTRGLVDGGVDALLIETMSDISEAKSALRGVRNVSDLPVIVSFSFDTRGRTMMGVKPDQAVEEFWSLGVTAVGANCGRTLTETLAAIEVMQAAVPEAVLLAKPNAGLPQAEGKELVYDVTPSTMAEYALKFAEAGVKIFGGCCGSTPQHIQAVAETINQLHE